MVQNINENKMKVSEDNNSGYKKYLTEIKELPPEMLVEEKTAQDKIPQKLDPNAQKSVDDNKSEDAGKTQNQISEQRPSVDEVNVLSENIDEGLLPKKLPFSSKDIILGVINLVSIVLLFIILSKLPEKAKEFNLLKSEKITSESSISYEFSGIEEAKLKSDEMKKLFIDEPGVVDFVNQVESLKVEGSSIKKISFATQNVVKDKTGNFGIPVVIELEGDWQVIGQDLEKVDMLPFLFRPARIEIERSTEEESLGVILFKYGVFLYVDDKLGKDR